MPDAITTPEVRPLAERLSKKHREYLHTMFTTACEGGIRDWAYLVTYRWMKQDGPVDSHGYRDADFVGFHAKIRSSEGDWGVSHLWNGHGLGEDEPIIIDLEVMHRGAELFFEYCQGTIDKHGNTVPLDQQTYLRGDHYWRQWMVQHVTLGDDGDSDAEVASEIVQWGLFGQSVYG